jgi:polygalacturonase
MSLTKVSYSMIQGAFVNVLDYGAVGDNTVDCTTAFQAAIDACPYGGTVFIPVGKFKLTAAITTSKAIQLTGAGFIWAGQ